MIYFTADTHWNHSNIAGPKTSNWTRGYRNFDSVHEMNEHLLDCINSVVQPDDILFHLGDFAFGNKKEIPNLRERIKCREIHLVYGNHDHALRKYYKDCFTQCYYEISEYFYKKQQFHMYHYPVASWNGIGRGAINLHGHCHGTFKGLPRQIDVGVDPNNFMPLSVEQIIEMAQDRPVQLVDHHDKNTNIR